MWIGNIRSLDRLGRWDETIDRKLGALLVLARGRTMGQRRLWSRAVWKGVGDHHRKPDLLTYFSKA